MRKITIFSTKGNRRQSINSGSMNWADLQEELSANGVDYDGLKAIVSSTQNTLESAEALLPEGDFTLMLIPGKVKSGSSNYIDMRFNDLYRLASQKGIEGLSSHPTKLELIEALEEYDEENEIETTEVEVEMTVEVEHVASIDISQELADIKNANANIVAAVESIELKLAQSDQEAAELDPELARLQEEARRIQENMG